MRHLATIRRVVAAVSIVAVTLLFLDFTGTVQPLWGWMARIQFLPAFLALNLVVLAALVAATLLLGRVYCSVVCPLGILQDILARIGRVGRRNPYRYSPPRSGLQLIVFTLFALAVVADFSLLVGLLAPYSSYGRMVSSALVPLWQWGNNLLASWAETQDSLAFYRVEGNPVAWTVVAVAAVTFVVIAVLAVRNGRTYCNTICPVGTILGYLSQYSWLKPYIDTSRCNGCGKCARNCKAACIDSKNHRIDYLRCVTCFDCIDKCSQGAIRYGRPPKAVATADTKGPDKTRSTDDSRRAFLTATVLAGGALAAKATDVHLDGGLAVVEDKKRPERRHRVTPPGSQGVDNMRSHCTACQLCVSVCPNHVLSPATGLDDLMQPRCDFNRGYCRPECTRCSQVCPTGAIRPVTREQRTALQVGVARWIRDNCLPVADGVSCGNCARHCPSGAIQMVPMDADNPDSLKIPVVNESRCIGCGACEYVCPSRPLSAIVVDGLEYHRDI